MRDWPLVGRAEELATLFDRLDREPPLALVVSGTAGVGKSRLLREVGTRAEQRRWPTHMVVGIRSAAAIPFGALAPLLDGGDDGSSFEVLTRLRHTLSAGDTVPLLLVDDAQRLDSGSAMLVHQVVAERMCRTVATVRSDEPVSDAIEGLWKDGWAERIELRSLSRDELGDLVSAALGGPVEGATRHRLWTMSGGNALYLRELVLGALADGSLRDEGGIWRQSGSPGLPPRLAELIEARLAALDSEAREALDVLALAEQIDLERLSELASLEAVERLEDEGLVEVIEETGTPLVVLSHPLYGETVRAGMAALRRRRVAGALADVLEASPGLGPADSIRLATWRLASGQPVDPELLTTAARRAYNANDYGLAERLATAARAGGAGVAAGLVLAESAMITGRHDAAAALLADLANEAVTDEQRIDVADSRVLVLGLYLGRQDDARAIVDQMAASLNDPDRTDALRAALGNVYVQAPNPLAAIEALRPLLDRPSGSCFYRGTYAASMAMSIVGALDEAVEVSRRGYEAHARLRSSVRFLPEAQFIGRGYALCGLGRAAEAADLVARGYDAAIAAHDPDLQCAFALLAGVVALHRGHLVSAGGSFREAAALNRQVNDVAGIRWSLGGVALAAAMRANRAESGEAVAELDELEEPPLRLYELDLVERGRAWGLVAAGERSRAATRLRAAADRAAATDQFVIEAVLRHDLARLGGGTAQLPRLAELAELIDGELMVALAHHVHASTTRDGNRLEVSARRLAELGHALAAQEAAFEAATLLERDGLRRRASACEALGERLVAECEGTRSPLTNPRVGPVALTAREKEIAALVVQDLSSREIAERLYLSRRTVENHLQRIYDKLGVSSRGALAAMLDEQRR